MGNKKADGTKHDSPSSSSSFVTPLSLSVLVLLLSLLLGQSPSPLLPSLTGPPAPTKPFQSFEEFYPFYRSEHTDHTNRILHFIGTAIILLLFLYHYSAIPSLAAAATVGYILCPLLIGIQHGFFEFAATIIVFLLLHKLSTGKIGVSAFIPLIGYSFAWVGHFVFEGNRPATFIYPTYSLMGDLKMFSRICLGQETF